MFTDDDTFTPTTAQVASLRDFLTLTEDAERVTLRTRKVRGHGVTHRDTPAERVKRDSLAAQKRNARRPSASTMFHRLDVCDLIG